MSLRAKTGETSRGQLDAIIWRIDSLWHWFHDELFHHLPGLRACWSGLFDITWHFRWPDRHFSRLNAGRDLGLSNYEKGDAIEELDFVSLRLNTATFLR